MSRGRTRVASILFNSRSLPSPSPPSPPLWRAAWRSERPARAKKVWKGSLVQLVKACESDMPYEFCPSKTWFNGVLWHEHVMPTWWLLVQFRTLYVHVGGHQKCPPGAKVHCKSSHKRTISWTSTSLGRLQRFCWFLYRLTFIYYHGYSGVSKHHASLKIKAHPPKTVFPSGRTSKFLDHLPDVGQFHLCFWMENSWIGWASYRLTETLLPFEPKGKLVTHPLPHSFIY